MKRPHLLAPLLNALLIASFLLYYNASTFPRIGLDYRYFLSRLVDTDLHYHVNGLTIQWYTPSFNGGLPAYPHPQNMQFSPVQALTALSDPWTATQINYFLLSVAGFLGAYLFLRRSLRLDWPAATLGAIFFSANGFIIQHIAAGHLNHQGFSLLPFFLIGLFDAGLSPLLSGILLAGLFALLIYSASFYPLTFLLLSLGILLPVLFLLRPQIFHWKRLALSALIGLPLGLGLTASKLAAVASFMRYFPRETFDVFATPLWRALPGLALQLGGVMLLAPLYALMGWKMSAMLTLLQVNTGASVGLWELDLSLTPVLWLALLAGAVLLLASWRRNGLPRQKSFWLALILSLFAAELALEFTLARGIFYPVLRELPVLGSLHINSRFGSAFLFPLAMLGAVSVQAGLQRLSKRGIQRGVFVGLNLLAILPLGAYLLLPVESMQKRIFDVSGLIAADREIHAGETFPIERVASDLNDAKVFAGRASSLKTLEMIFGYAGEQFGAQLVDGPARLVTDGAYNMLNPSGLVFPVENNTAAWERIPASQGRELEDFLAHRQPDWKISSAQKAANGVSLLALAAVVGLLAVGLRRS